MGALPLVSIIAEFALQHGGADPIFLIGKWFVFWSVGVRLMLAGLRQIAQPSFTADAIFGVKDKGALIIVQELGFGDLSIGLLGALTLSRPDWIAPSAIVGGCFYALAGFRHLIDSERNTTENVAMVSDLLIAVVLAVYLAARMA
jgi:hypothetical protein